MNKFDLEINNILSEKRIIKKRHKKDVKLRIPNTPGNIPASNKSPALRSGPSDSIAGSPMPLSI